MNNKLISVIFYEDGGCVAHSCNSYIENADWRNKHKKYNCYLYNSLHWYIYKEFWKHVETSDVPEMYRAELVLVLP